MKHYFYSLTILGLLTFSSISFGQKFYGVTSTDGTYGGGTIFSYDANAGTYTDEVVFKPNPVFDAYQLFEESDGVYVGVCDRSYENTIYGNPAGDAIFRYSGGATYIDEIPYPFHAQVSKYNPGHVAYLNHDKIIGIVVLPNDSIGLLSFSVSGDTYSVIEKYNSESYPAEGVYSYMPNGCYFTALDDHRVLFSLRKIKGEPDSGTSSEGYDYFIYDTQTNSVDFLLNVPYGDKFSAYGPFVNTIDNRWISQGSYGKFMEIDIANKTYSLTSPYADSHQYNEDGRMMPVTDSTLLAFMEWGSYDYLIEYNYKNNTLSSQYLCGDRNNINSFVEVGDSVYFSFESSDQFRIFSYKPGSGNAPSTSFLLTDPAQGSIKYLIETSLKSAPLIAFHDGISEYYPAKGAYVNMVRFAKSYFWSYKDGATPQSDLLLASNKKLYGFVTNGGRGTYWDGDGILFEYDPISKQYMKLHEFTGDDGGFGSKDSYGTNYGKGQNNLTEYNGKLYGTTYTNGVRNGQGPTCGTIFTYDLDAFGDNFKTIYDFNDSTNASTGRLPMSGLVPGPDNKLYGTTPFGGIPEDGVNEGYGGYGVLYSIDPAHNDTFEIVMKFSDTCTVHPIDDLVYAGNGIMYGFADAMDGGYWNKKWAIRKYDITNKTYTNIYVSDLNDHEVGNSGFLYLNGKLYGMITSSSNGGAYLYEFDIATKQLVKKVVLIGSKGTNPYGNLTLGSNGSLWGMAKEGGDDNVGVIFEYDITGDTYTKHHDFGWDNGRNPMYSCLTEVSDGSTGIFGKDNLEKDELKAYPNPTTDFVRFDFSDNRIQDIEYYVYSISGTMVSTGTAKVSENLTIDLSSLDSGIYTVKIKTESKTFTKKIIKR